MPPHPPVFVINLDRDAGRMTAMRAALEAQGIGFRRVAATLGAALPPRELAARTAAYFWRERRRLTAGEIGCALSHRDALKAFLATGAPIGVILEDDVAISPDFALMLSRLATFAAPVFDVLKLEGLDLGASPPLGWLAAGAFAEAGGPFTPPRRLFIPLTASLGSAAYAVNRKAAQRLVTACARISAPYDWTLTDRIGLDLALLELRPFPARQLVADARSITQERAALREPQRTIAYRLRKSFDKRLAAMRLRLYLERRSHAWPADVRSQAASLLPEGWR